jgi:hypothetical protein
MALYFRQADIGVATTGTEAFNQEYKPGSTPDHSGIFRCKGCGREVVGEQARTLPPQNHHQHTQSQGAVIWRMDVYAQHEAH